MVTCGLILFGAPPAMKSTAGLRSYTLHVSENLEYETEEYPLYVTQGSLLVYI